MFDKSDLKAAETAGVLSTEQAKRLVAFLENRADPGAPSESENLRFLANFNDIFITIGIVLLAMGLTTLTDMIVSPMAAGMVQSYQAQWFVPFIFLPVAAVMWLMAEYFSRRRRLLLPSMALIAIFTLCIAASVGAMASGFTGPKSLTKLTSGISMVGNVGLAGFIGGFGAAALAFWRFRLPFTFLLMAFCAAGAVYTFAGFHGSIGQIVGGTAFLLVGLITLAVAVWFDAKDPTRVTRNSDHAFWLHLAAAPQIVWGLRSMITGSGYSMPGPVGAMLILLTLGGLAVLALALNRRALIAAGLFTLAMALRTIVAEFGGGLGTTSMVTLILLGSAIILLGGGWHTARRMVLKLVPQTPLTRRIFPPEIRSK